MSVRKATRSHQKQVNKALKQPLSLTAVSTLILEKEEVEQDDPAAIKRGEKKYTVKEKQRTIQFVTSQHFKKDHFYNGDGSPNEEGTKTTSSLLIKGLVGNIGYADKMGYIPVEAHINSIIAELTTQLQQQGLISFEPPQEAPAEVAEQPATEQPTEKKKTARKPKKATDGEK